ncbi:MAG TPA: TIGR02302 family protein [Stellaceae bacterium]|nr:TIGR02302 family protein [Stellaceae bacterium]
MVDIVIPSAPAALKRRLGLATAALFWERLWPALWPAACVVGIFLALALFDIPAMLPNALRWILLAVFVIALTAALFEAANRFRLPRGDAARRRIETASGMRHRPLAALQDKLASNADPATASLWLAHQRRMADAARRMKVGLPAAGLARRDPYALRVALALLLLLGAVDAGDDWAARLVRAVSPGIAAPGAAAAVSFDVWVTPPDYTGLPPQFLSATTAGPVAVPIGSTLLAQVHGGRNPPRLKIDDRASDFARIDESNFKDSATIAAGKRIAIDQDGRSLGAWPIQVVPDLPPQVTFARPPSRSARMALRLDYTAGDDYGVESIKAVIHRADDPGGPALTLNLPLPGQHLKDARATDYTDLTANLWAGLPVQIELQATDALGQVGRSEIVQTVLPERVFHNPIAKAIVEARKQLTLHPSDKEVVAETLSDLSLRPVRFNNDIVAFMALRTAQARLLLDRDGSSIAPVQELLWQTALRIEDGRAPATQQDLRNAMQALQDALARNAPNDEIERLMRQVQEAMNRYFQALAQQMQHMDPSQMQAVDPSQMMSLQDLQKMLDRARDMARTGARDQARNLLSQLQQMLENLRLARPMQGNGSQNQMMSQMQQMMRQQQQLLDRSFNQSRNGQSQNLSGDAQQQEALRQMLSQMMQRLQQQGGQAPQGLSRAERAMRGAAEALQRGQPGQAIGPQSDALDALQEAARSMANQMLGRNYGDGPGGEPFDDPGLHQAQRDPFGRLLDTEEGNGGYDDGGQLRMGKSANDYALDKAKQILDELRRRAGERSRPALERDYIDRLLKEF